ncbi:ATP synthase subunit I [Thiolinea disciformis]|uniref:ATP synthase subunit I n=1 Tax=Thiolinea disciformis TaxID=125614 RepID=UPI00035FFFE6|nr:ATP synthase subunit I [Thiolinea disciformis]
MQSVLIIQATLILLSTIGFVFYQGEAALTPALYGGAIALVSTLLLKSRGAQVEEIAKTNPQQSLYHLYGVIVLRFVLVLGGLGFGLGYLKFPVTPLLVTFMVAQVAYMLAGSRQAAR